MVLRLRIIMTPMKVEMGSTNHKEVIMLEFYVRASYTRARFRSGPVGPYIDGFAGRLRAAGYREQTGSMCIRHAVHLGTWANGQHIALESYDEGVLVHFVGHLQQCRCPGGHPGRHRSTGAHASMFLEYLWDQGVVSRPVSISKPENPLVEMFCRWMVHHRGATTETLRAYRRVTERLVTRVGSDPELYTAPVIRDAVVALSAGRGLATAEQVITVSRTFLRYLTSEGRCRSGLDGALPSVAPWRLRTLPRHVSMEDVQKIINACDTTEIGAARDCDARDRAMILLMARLGLRAGDLVNLRLQDIDWGAARLRVTGKGRREVRLPLPQDAGDALLAYLTEHRPQATSDRVFLTANAPIGPIRNSSAVSSLVRRAIQRAGIEAPATGAHLLRHSAACALLRDGVSLPSIGVLLRHRFIDTTAQYAKVDVDMLRGVAQSWIGGAP